MNESGEQLATSGMAILSRFKVGHRIYAGFIAVLVLLVALSLLSIFSFRDQASQFANYSAMASDAKLVDDLSREVIKTQLAQRNYFDTSAEPEKAAFVEQYERVLTLMKQAKTDIQDPARVALS